MQPLIQELQCGIQVPHLHKYKPFNPHFLYDTRPHYVAQASLGLMILLPLLLEF